MDQDNITDKSSYWDLNMAEFVLQDVVVSAVSQILIGCQGKGIRVACNLPERFEKQNFYGDGIRLQQILSDFLFVSVKFSPVGGSVDISFKLTKNSIDENLHLIGFKLRIKNQGPEVPAEILSQTYEEGNKEQSDEGLNLLVSRKLLRLMNGDICHLREAGMSTFILTAAPSAIGQ